MVYSFMVDPIVSLAFSMHSLPGVYALLLGSGISRAAGIPTGWEIILDLILKLARIHNEEAYPDPETWYHDRFKTAPNYSSLIEALAKTQAERSQLLRAYFEPSPEDAEEGLKMPTEAHKAVAELVQSGHIRLIITTNFDRLIEKAIEEKGITPTVISSPESVDGALSIVHSRCTIIKVNGDYLDLRSKNTIDELSNYDERMAELLDRTFDEFGLIICGWSADWDVALCKIIEGSRNRRFATYWAYRGGISDTAKRLIDLRGATPLAISDANSFFRELEEKVTALQELSRPHPLSTQMAVQNIKKYLADERYRIRLSDLVTTEVERLYSELNDTQLFAKKMLSTGALVLERMRKYEALSEIVLTLMAHGCYWGKEEHRKIWIRALERIANPAGGRSSYGELINLDRYPALLLFYTAGISSLYAERYDTLAALFLEPKVENDRSLDGNFFLKINSEGVLSYDNQKQLPGRENGFTPLSDHIFNFLRTPLQELIPSDAQYQNYFDLFEYIFSLACVHANRDDPYGPWAPMGCFSWRYRVTRKGGSILESFARDVSTKKENHPLLKSGLFEDSMTAFQAAKDWVDGHISKIGWR